MGARSEEKGGRAGARRDPDWLLAVSALAWGNVQALEECDCARFYLFPWCVRNVNSFVFVERKECQITCFCGVRNGTSLVSMARKEDDLT